MPRGIVSHFAFVRSLAVIQVQLAIRTRFHLRVVRIFSCFRIRYPVELNILCGQNWKATSEADVAKRALGAFLIAAQIVGCVSMR